MEVILLKDSHVGKKGESKDFPDPRANYLIRIGLAEPTAKVKKEAAEKKAVKKEPIEKKAEDGIE